MTPCSSGSIVNFEHVIAGWAVVKIFYNGHTHTHTYVYECVCIHNIQYITFHYNETTIKIRVGGREGVWNYWVSHFPNFLENCVILKKKGIILTPHEFILMSFWNFVKRIYWFFLSGDNEIRIKNAYWDKPEKIARRKIEFLESESYQWRHNLALKHKQLTKK